MDEDNKKQKKTSFLYRIIFNKYLKRNEDQFFKCDDSLVRILKDEIKRKRQGGEGTPPISPGDSGQ